MASHCNLTVYRGWDSPGVYVWSPFVTKVEARLRFAGRPYHCECGSIPKAPRGKVPYISISDSKSDTSSSVTPRLLSDSTLIFEGLVEDGIIGDLNAKLSPVEKAHDAGLRALLEDKLYFYQVSVEIRFHLFVAFLKFIESMPKSDC